ncbi:hypothetical protein [Flagellimonas onchidii]|uniref:hypothetical protein n=1 Tax=Flagellimonas onchidii TaxID=2562684 RepID=UPI0010A696F7|nr:hypothetical protein [Allomuricauda onchidii]
MNKKLYINISIFHHDFGWHELILKSIEQFVKITGIFDSFFIILSRTRGDHVVLFIETDKKEAKELAQEANHYFKTYLRKWTEKDELNFPRLENRIFRDFEDNTIHFGIHNDFFGIKDEFTLRLCKDISQLVILSFKKYGSNLKENLLDMFLELYALLVQFSYKSKEEILQIFEFLLNQEYQKYSNSTVDDLKVEYEKCFIENQQIIASFFNIKKTESINPIKTMWKKMINKYWSKPKSTHLKDFEILIISITNDSFAFSNKILGYYLFARGLEEHMKGF